MRIRTAALVLRIERKPLRFTLYRAGDETPLWRELQPLDMARSRRAGAVQRRRRAFFGGGQQNGRYRVQGPRAGGVVLGRLGRGRPPQPGALPAQLQAAGACCATPGATAATTCARPDQATLQHREGPLRCLLLRRQGPARRARAATPNGPAAPPAAALGAGIRRRRLLQRRRQRQEAGHRARRAGATAPPARRPDVVDSVAKRTANTTCRAAGSCRTTATAAATPAAGNRAGLAGYGFRTGLWTENGVDKIAWEVGTGRHPRAEAGRGLDRQGLPVLAGRQQVGLRRHPEQLRFAVPSCGP
jgi:alpha-glucosidase